MAVAKLKQAVTQMSTSFPVDSGELKDFSASLEKIGAGVKSVEDETGFSFRDLPGVNREARLLLGQLPGLRQAMRVYFNTKRLARGLDVGGIQLYLSIAVTALLLAQQILASQRRMELKQLEYDAFIARERGLSMAEFHTINRLPRIARDSYFRSTPTP